MKAYIGGGAWPRGAERVALAREPPLGQKYVEAYISF
jgi:hypothetical protein